MMNIAELIEDDIACVREYCTRLISFADASSKDFVPPSSKRPGTVEYLPISVAYLVRPDLISNIYALADFRLKTLCEHHHGSGKAPETFQQFRKRDKSKTSDLARYRKYFQSVAQLDLSPLLPSFNHLDLMRRIRNSYMHHGGHADEETSRLVAGVTGVSMSSSVLIVSDAYIHESLEHAARILLHIAQA